MLLYLRERSNSITHCRPMAMSELLSNVVDEDFFGSVEEPLRGLLLIFSSASPRSTSLQLCSELTLSLSKGQALSLPNGPDSFGIAGGETAVIGFACTSGFGGGGKIKQQGCRPAGLVLPDGSRGQVSQE